ncbi:phosphotransferase family protein [Spirochaeta dissipatitropha]
MHSKSKINIGLAQITRLSRAAMDTDTIEAHELTDGWANTIYRIKVEDGRTCVLKISPPSDCPVMRYEKDLIYTETAVLELLAKHRIPVPEVYAFLEANEVIDHPCFFMEFIEGSTLSAVRQSPDFRPEDNLKIDRKLGVLQAEINNIGQKFDFWGSVTDKGKRFESWYDCFNSMMMDLIRDAEDVSSDLGFPVDDIQSILDASKQALHLDTQAALVLWDLHDGNIIMNDHVIRAVIDCDRSFLGDPLMEFWFRGLAGDRGELRTAFQKTISSSLYRNDDPDTITRIKLYDLYLALVMRIECDFRGFAEDHRAWTQEQLIKAVLSAEEAVNALS